MVVVSSLTPIWVVKGQIELRKTSGQLAGSASRGDPVMSCFCTLCCQQTATICKLDKGDHYPNDSAARDSALLLVLVLVLRSCSHIACTQPNKVTWHLAWFNFWQPKCIAPDGRSCASKNCLEIHHLLSRLMRHKTKSNDHWSIRENKNNAAAEGRASHPQWRC